MADSRACRLAARCAAYWLALPVVPTAAAGLAKGAVLRLQDWAMVGCNTRLLAALSIRGGGVRGIVVQFGGGGPLGGLGDVDGICDITEFGFSSSVSSVLGLPLFLFFSSMRWVFVSLSTKATTITIKQMRFSFSFRIETNVSFFPLFCDRKNR